ncbi:HNH endonuclease family protein [Rothia sp. CCM 9419]|uniref:HNH endonuclease family protein n=1 Tax=Rothia sp. CCM 9419 TaxID=3402662 RepID=UPI003AE202B7
MRNQYRSSTHYRTYRHRQPIRRSRPFFLRMSTLFWAVLIGAGIFLWTQHEKIEELLGAPNVPVETGFARHFAQPYSTASEVLKTLPVQHPAGARGYSRSQFGPSWEDIDRNGCDQRNDVLARDLSHVKYARGCKVASGTFIDPYTAESIDFLRGEKTSPLVPIDHVVALSNAWQTGAAELPLEQRQRLANDPLNLQATGYDVNTEKSNQDASQWLPQRGYRCEYVARQISVKAIYHLWVTPAEKQAMENVLKECPQQPAYRSGLKR